ncbi:hypothetical protein Q0Z83_029020 [Actinoplanes sichuanensis]|uniref:DUF4132 domain-containing protein n=1 Tax=Actinoplanes sichuanensis TaxID=512349 RepID=A0ABW4AW14_9ACTN|nr:DUF4132 domain-containing protein [Actinoplanes sichuanensis]BEL04711.1 hypothetical protein Q0Z83_029020 [Actinoplanes sichuanensis]
MLPDGYADVIHTEQAALAELVETARAADQATLAVLADEITRRIERGNGLAGGHLKARIGHLTGQLDEIFDAAFPVGDPGDLRHILDIPWPTASRRALLSRALRVESGRLVMLDETTEQAIAAGDVRLMLVLIHTPLGYLARHSRARLLQALHVAGALDAAAVERAFTADRHLWDGIGGRLGLTCAESVRDHLDAFVWRLVTAPEPPPWMEFPDGPVPRGLRFLRAALAWPGDRQIADHLGSAELTTTEQAELVTFLRDRPEAEQQRVWRWRVAAGDADTLLPAFDLEAAAPLLRLIRAMPDGHEPFRQDRAAVLATVEAVGVESARRLLKRQPHELVSAVLGDNRAAVLKRVKNNALQGIAAFGMLPLAPDETVLDRYLAIREIAKRGPALGPNRRISHAAAVDVALDHLSQVSGAGFLEWDCEAQIAAEAPTTADAGDYRVELRFDGADPVLAVSRAGKPLKSVPAAVRSHASYRELREHQERLREQARRMRTGLVERLVATTATLTPDELARLRSLPAGEAMLPGLIWRDRGGVIGLLDDVDVTGPVTAVHPFDLLTAGTLAHWQEEVVRRRLRQPVKQAFRELYVLTPAERAAVGVSQRFAGQTVTGRVAAQLLAGRGWSTGHEYGDHQATRPAGDGVVAALSADLHGYWGMGDVVIGGLRFLRDDRSIPLADVSPVVFSEVMRDLDLAVSVAGTAPERWGSPAQAESRARVLTALIDDLGLTGVTVDGTAAVVRGTRATYRVHLTSGSIHVEPAGYLCVVPADFGAAAHPRLFLPFADDDRMTSVILSKVLLLSEDDRITDPSILQQLKALT